MLDNTIAQAEALTSAGNNIEGEGKLTSKQVYARVRELGKQEGKGSNSRPVLFFTVTEGGKARAIKKDDVAAIFEEYSRHAAAARGAGWQKQDSTTQQVAKLGVALRLGELPHVDGVKLLEKVIAFQKEQRDANDGVLDYSPFDGMVLVGRYQLNKSPAAMLGDDVIRGLLLKPAKDIAEEADILERHVKALQGTIDATKVEKAVSEESREVLRQARELIEKQIIALGGSTADKKAAAKAEAEAVELIDLAEKAKARVIALRPQSVIDAAEANAPQ